MAETMPAGLTTEAARIARDTLGGAVSVAGQLSGELGASLLVAARLSFTTAFHVAAVVSASIAIGLFIVVLVWQRNPAGVPVQSN
jgi:DHA2 family multidrug resistance protein-like MFS transporter